MIIFVMTLLTFMIVLAGFIGARKAIELTVEVSAFMATCALVVASLGVLA